MTPSAAASNPKRSLSLGNWIATYGNVIFADRLASGILCLLATAIYPAVIMGGLGGLLVADALIYLLGLPESGRVGARLNALLAGAAIAALWSPVVSGPIWWAAYPLTILLAISLSMLLGDQLWRAGNFPTLSLPFSMSVWVVLPLLGGVARAQPELTFVWLSDPWLTSALTAFGWIFLSPHPLSGILVLVAILISSRYLFMLALVGYVAGQLTLLVLAPQAMLPGFAFNFPLAAIAVGGFYSRPNIGSLLLGAFASVLSALGCAVLAKLFGSSGALAFSLPFVAATLLSLALTRYATRGVELALLYPAAPERQAEAERLARARLGARGSFPLALPFHGTWRIYQGFDGEHTHRGPWRHALDFFITESDKSYRQDGQSLSDYYCFGLPILAPVAGTIVIATGRQPDNPPGFAEPKENWGNHVVIRTFQGPYVWLAHLRQGTICVVPGQIVQVGTPIGQCGNSGRSVQPHVHMHAQASAAPGSPTVPFHLDNILKTELPPSDPDNDNAGAKRQSWYLSCIPRRGEWVAPVSLEPKFAEALALPVGLSLEFEVRRGNSPWSSWSVEVAITLLGQLRLVTDKASMAVETGPHAIALHDRQGGQDPWLNLFALSVGLSPLSAVSHWCDKPSASLFPAGWPTQFGLWLLHPLGSSVDSSFAREYLHEKKAWRQQAHHTLRVIADWKAELDCETEIVAPQGVIRIFATVNGETVEMRLVSRSQIEDEGIPGWKQAESSNRIS